MLLAYKISDTFSLFAFKLLIILNLLILFFVPNAFVPLDLALHFKYYAQQALLRDKFEEFNCVFEIISLKNNKKKFIFFPFPIYP